ncbi:MAG TPA: DNA-processing protein DprA [Acidimicrobiales bacterium]|jgi:DNA processing protein|nr:DNA-processing protein DprA [Acidimicrobiales bacterium]
MVSGSAGLPPEAYAAALAGMPGVGPARLRELLDRWSPVEAWEAAGDPRVDVAERWSLYVEGGVAVHLRGSAGYPPTLVDDHEAPALLFSVGDVGVVDGPRVAIIGSRRCTRYGRDVAFDLGRDLARIGVRVVSGLALGIDGAAHLGVLAAGDGAAPPVAVVGSGLDVVYPRAHRRLWTQVAEAGVVLSEAPLGARPEPWRFPARNRILAALADVVVVVESRTKGGSFHTVQAADQRGVTVMAVPGPVRSPASAYTNELLVSGSPPARDVDDVLVALDLRGRGPKRKRGSSATAQPPPDDPHQAALLEAMGWQPSSLDQLVVRTGLSPGQASVALAHLEVGGWIVGQAGWWERDSSTH